MTSRELRDTFLKYFERQEHRIVPSSSLVPFDDPTLLFTNAGMNQFKDVFLGHERRDYTRAATSQKCMRVSGKHNDLDNVGPSLRHHTFFEMLGNFSFGDYFKKDAIAFAWELMTEVWGIPAERLYSTVFRGEAGIPRDDEAYRHWLRFLPADRIVELGLEDNFWAMGDTGPSGRCSEVHYYRGPELSCPETVCRGVECSCDRFIEVWNNVFMEFDRQPDGALKPLPAPSIDTGMGLERIAAVMQDTLSNYDTDLFQPMLHAISDMTAVPYGRATATDVSMRVVADHLRATTFLIADGVMPSNEWRGYVLRKIMRRAMRHAKRLGRTEPMLFRLVDVVVHEMAGAYPELGRNRDAVVQVVRREEERFDAVLNAGLPRLEEVLDRTAGGSQVVPGEEMFRLYDSFGLPVDFIEDLAGERRLTIDRAGFERAMESQRERGRAAGSFEAGRAGFTFTRDADREALREPGDVFEGYTTTRVGGIPLLALFDETRRQVDRLEAPSTGYMVLPGTPFYLEAGGQVSDTGRILSEASAAEGLVDGLTRVGPGLPRAHHVRVTTGAFRARDLVTAEVDAQTRDATRRNHTATHLLHAALRQVLGPHVKQAGSLVAPDRLRFDFIHFAPLTRDQMDEIERIVNEQIQRNAPVQTEVRATADAIAAGAMALFGEKYGDRVRVVSVPGFSTELCGGTHCRATGDIGVFVITQETGVAAGVRRIEALTGTGAVRHSQVRRAALGRLLDTLAAPEDEAVEAVERLQHDVRRLGRELSELKLKAAMGASEAPADDVAEIAGVKMIARRVNDLEKPALRGLADVLKARLKSGIVILGSATNGKVSIVVSVTRDLTDRLNAGRIVKEIAPIVGGGGGGRPDFAEAGGKDPQKIDEMLAHSRALIRRMLETARG
ncbi:MAG: alanine--tRNA ligase [Acidobacteria bacterium]|nr:alanine--tRNA ligase [Acidobacteriota bacterium]